MSEGFFLGLEFKYFFKIDLLEIGSERSDENEDVKDDEIGESWLSSKV